jgi:hypothetical protein
MAGPADHRQLALPPFALPLAASNWDWETVEFACEPVLVRILAQVHGERAALWGEWVS